MIRLRKEIINYIKPEPLSEGSGKIVLPAKNPIFVLYSIIAGLFYK